MLRRHFTSLVQSNSDSGGVPGFVDLGLSVMWASCNLGANSPEGVGEKYTFIKGTGNFKNSYISLNNDPVYSSYSDTIIQQYYPRVPTVELYIELYNLPKQEEVLNGVNGYRFTGTNGNSIFLPGALYWTPVIYYISGGGVTTHATAWEPYGGIHENEYDVSNQFHYRGVCRYPPQGGATFLEYGQAVSIAANDTALYCFPATWTSTQFLSSAQAAVSMYVSNQPDFTPSVDDANVQAVYPFYKNEGLYELRLSSKDINTLNLSAQDNYLYVRFHAAEATTITPEEWAASECADRSTVIISGEMFAVASKSANTIYRLRYDDWKDGEMVISWDAAVALPVYIADTCQYTLSKNNKHVVQYKNITTSNNIARFDAEVVNSWASRVDADGFLYVRFNPSKAGDVTFVCEKQIVADPIYTTITDTLC